MADLRKLVASAITSGTLESDDVTECELDRVMALGLSAVKDPLGAALWRLKWANDAKAYQPALALLFSRFRQPRRSSRTMYRICECVLREWVDEVCRNCQGRGVMVIEDTPYASHSCVACDGTGLRTPSQLNRIAVTGLPPAAYPKWESEFARARGVIDDADATTWTVIASLLGRIRGRKARPAKLTKYLPKGIELG